MTNPALALNDRVQSPNEIIAAMRAAPKPVRITGKTRDSVLRFVLSPINTDPEIERRFRIIRHNLGGTLPPLVEADAPDTAVVLVIAFENLLRVSRASWSEFIRDYWIDGPLSLSADRPHSEWAARLAIPASILAEARSVILLGYQKGNQVRSPFIPQGWEAA